MAEDFTIVKNSQKRCDNINLVSNSQQQEAISKDSESSENKTLAEMIGYDEKTLSKKRSE